MCYNNVMNWGIEMLYVHNLMKKYGNNETLNILDGVNLEVKEAVWCSIVGPSGTGKSTLLKCIAGLLKPDDGSVRMLNHDIYSMTEEARSNFRRTNIGFIFQDFKLLSHYSVLENVIMPLLYDKDRKWLMEKAKDLLKLVGIPESLHNRLPDSLSGGEKQRVAIARSIIGDPEIILCDEPTGNLDTKNRDRIIELLLNIQKRGTTIICVTHDLEVAEKGDCVYRLNEGLLTKEEMIHL